MTFMRKFLDMLKMENWNTSNEEMKSSSQSETEYPNWKKEETDRREESERVLEEKRVEEEKEDALRKAEKERQDALRLAEQKMAEILKRDELEREEELRMEEAKKHSPYISNRMVIPGLHLYFIDIAREIVSEKSIKKIPLMREYRLSENELSEVIKQIQEAGILDLSQNVLMSTNDLEKFFDIYEPSIFKCANSVFDKDIFMVMGEIVFENGIEYTYNTLTADEVVDYLNIMENLKIISYDCEKNNYDILISKEEFYRICECIPNSFANTNYVDTGIDYSGADFDAMSGVEFEKYCAHILSLNGFSEIKITPASGDHGIDILAIKNEISYAIQCKCYSDNVGNAAVQQAHTGKSLYHKDIAVVLTNRYFTAQATEEANALGVKLWNRDKLNEMIKNQ